MKFGKEFVSQMVPEWQEAYLDYNSLKSLLKDLVHFKQSKTPPPPMASTPKGSVLKRRASLYRAFSGLTNRHRDSPKAKEGEEILISEDGADGRYLQTFVTVSDEEREYEVKFFNRLDDEFNKVIRFYKKEVTQVVEEADELSRQMDALIALRLKVDNPVVDFGDDSYSVVQSTNGRRPGINLMICFFI